jgi:hypothetical protein
VDGHYDALITIHRAVGYPTAFVVGPLALLAFARPALHRKWGQLYLCMMSFLYLTGTFFTLTKHDWHSWEFVRNLTFNFFGFSMLLYGWRAIHLFRQEGQPRPVRLDWFLAGLLGATVLAVVAVATVRDTPMRLFTLVGVTLCVLEVRDLRAGFQPKSLLFRRHLRFILASYFYVMTVVSIVHLNDELPRTLKWTWPTFVGGLIIYLATAGTPRQLLLPRGKVLRSAVWATLVLAVLYGGYAVYDLARGGASIGQAADATVGPTHTGPGHSGAGQMR